jgi:hypothetical protein
VGVAQKGQLGGDGQIAPAARVRAEAISRRLPWRSPTVGLSCKKAIFIEVVKWTAGNGIKLFGARKALISRDGLRSYLMRLLKNLGKREMMP